MASVASSNSPGDVRRIIEAMVRQKRKVFVFVVVTLLMGLAIILFFPRKYRSQSKLFLQLGRENVGIDPTATVGQTITMQASGRTEELQSTMDVLTSRGIVSQVVDRLGVDVIKGGGKDGEQSNNITAAVRYLASKGADIVKRLDPIPPREEAIIDVEKSIDVEAEEDSAVITVSVDSKTPQLAQEVLSALVDVYHEEHARMHRNALSQPFFQEQRTILGKQLDAALAKLRDAKIEMGITSLEERRINEERQLRYVGLDLFEAEQNFYGAEAQVKALQRKLETIPERAMTTQRNMPNTGADLLQDSLYQLEIRKFDMESRFSPTHPLVTSITQQVEEAKKAYAEQKELRQESVDDMNPLYQELSLALKLAESQLDSYRARRDQAAKQREQVIAAINKLNEDEANLDVLERDVELARNNFSQYAESFEQSRIDNALKMESISNLNIVQQATLSYKPVSPRKGIVAALTLCIAMFGSVAIALFFDRLDTAIRTAEDVESELNLPVLASLPKTERSHLAVT